MPQNYKSIYDEGYKDGYEAAEKNLEPWIKPCYYCKFRPDKIGHDYNCANCYEYELSAYEEDDNG